MWPKPCPRAKQTASAIPAKQRRRGCARPPATALQRPPGRPPGGCRPASTGRSAQGQRPPAGSSLDRRTAFMPSYAGAESSAHATNFTRTHATFAAPGVGSAGDRCTAPESAIDVADVHRIRRAVERDAGRNDPLKSLANGCFQDGWCRSSRYASRNARRVTTSEPDPASVAHLARRGRYIGS